MSDTAPVIDKQKSTEDQFESQQLKFSQGILFRGKFFGVEDVKKETGDDICQDSMVKLKAVLAAKKESKQRICIKINIEGIEIVDEKTNTPMYKHSVNRISYIARDIKDARAIGYIYKNSENSFQYFGLRTIDQAQIVFNTLKELFEVVLKIRTMKKKEGETSTSTTTPSTTGNTNSPAAPSTTTTTTPSQPVDSPKQEDTKPTGEPEKKPELLNDISTKTEISTNSESQPVASSLVNFDDNKPVVTEQNQSDPFDLLGLSNPAQTPSTPINNQFSQLSLNDSPLTNPLVAPRPAPNPMTNNLFTTAPSLTPNPMIQSQGFPSQPPFFQNLLPAQTGFQAPTNSPMSSPMNPNLFGNQFSNSIQPQRPPMAPMASMPPMSSPIAQNPNFNNLFPMPTNTTPNANNAKPNPFNW